MNFCSFNTMELSDVENGEQVVVFDQFSNYSSFDEERISSASGSLKWSCDVENQNNNKNDWELIENIFYGEEKLPEDENTREEFLEWMEAFPHLRVIGKKIDSPISIKRSFNVQFEEIFAIDPPVSKLRNDSFVLLEHELNEKLSIRRSQQNCAYQIKNNDIEKCLKITSSGILQSHQQQQKSFSATKKTVDQTATYVINPINFGGRRKLSKIQEYKKYDFHSSTNHQQLKNNCELDDIMFSAVSPRILNIKFLLSKPDEISCDSKPCSLKIKSATSKLSPTTYFNRIGVKINKNNTSASTSSKSASLHKGKQPHVLQMPSLNYDFVVGRSISAVSKKRYK